jgi:hypothetical protein
MAVLVAIALGASTAVAATRTDVSIYRLFGPVWSAGGARHERGPGSLLDRVVGRLTRRRVALRQRKPDLRSVLRLGEGTGNGALPGERPVEDRGGRN